MAALISSGIGLLLTGRAIESGLEVAQTHTQKKKSNPNLELESNMIIFTCADCSEKINADDSETPTQILDKLDEHVRNCPRASFTSEATTDAAQQRLNDLRAAIENWQHAGKIQR
jgi:hypothetical protein